MSRSFRKTSHGPVLSREERSRQSEAVRSALASLGADDARAFLNRHHSGLLGRPLDLAVASEAGLTAVQIALGVESGRPAESG